MDSPTMTVRSIGVKGSYLTVANAHQIGSQIEALLGTAPFMLVNNSTHPANAPIPMIFPGAKLVAVEVAVNPKKITGDNPHDDDPISVASAAVPKPTDLMSAYIRIIYSVPDQPDMEQISLVTDQQDGEDVLQDPAYRSPHIRFEKGMVFITYQGRSEQSRKYIFSSVLVPQS